jgi:hypothetical protein
VAKVSGVAEFAEILQANWVIISNVTKKMVGNFFVGMVSSEISVSKN